MHSRWYLFSDEECLKIFVSKLIGFAIITGSLILKVPQIIKIVSSKSAKGLAASMYFLEAMGFSIVIAFALREKMPFSAFGENFFMFCQSQFKLLLCFTSSL